MTRPPAADAADGAAAVRWSPDRAVAISPDGQEVWLFGGAGPVRLAGRGTGSLAAAVDGRRTLSEVVAAGIAGGLPADEAQRIACKWRDSGHLQPVAPDPGPPVVRLIDRSEGATLAPGPEARSLARALSLAGVTVAGMTVAGMTDAGMTDAGGTAADGAGRNWADAEHAAGEPCATIVLLDDLLTVSSAVHGLTDPVIAVQVHGTRALVSPLLGPGESCPDCLDYRLRMRRVPDLVGAQRVGRALPPPSPLLLPGSVPLAAGVLAGMAYDLHVRRAHGVGTDRAPWGRLSVIDARAGRVDHHVVVPVAACPRCDPDGPSVASAHLDGGPPATAATDREVDAQSGGGFRLADPIQTWTRYRDLVSDVVGVVPYVVPTGPPELRAYSAGPNIAAREDLALLRSRLRSAAGGKGLTLSAARTGALAEALERHSLAARGNEPHRRARWGELDRMIHPNDVQLFSDRQLRRSAALHSLGLATDGEGSGFHRVPLPFDEEAEHDWSPVADLGTGAVHWMLSSLTWFGWPSPPGYPHGSSNGAAAGNTLAEALLQGLLELVERDAVALWWYPRCHRPAVDLDGWDDPRVQAARAAPRAVGTDAWVLDLTTDLGIPAAVAIATGLGPWPQAPLVGFGAHLDPALAVVRALTELAQVQAPLAGLRPGDPFDLPGTAEQAWFTEVTPDREPWLLPHGVVPPATSPDYAGIDDALADAVDRVSGRGLTVLWADCTRPDLGLPVVRTWAPGLRHFWNRFAPGRLFDVPPALGWCPPGYGEDDLNPRAMIL